MFVCVVCIRCYGNIIDVGLSLLSVYEVSTLELWSFQSYTALDSRHDVYFYYLALIFLLVIIVQQSIFLVVIVESFADVRSDSNLVIRSKPQPRPDFVSDKNTDYQVLVIVVVVVVIVIIAIIVSDM